MTEEKSNIFQRVLGNFSGQTKVDEQISLEEPQAVPPAFQEERQEEPTGPAKDDHVSLGQRLLEDGFHPLLVFGTRATGKTTFLTSMLAFFTSMPDVGVTLTLGDQLLHSDAGFKAHESAERLFHLQVDDYINGTAPAITQETYPFFVPLELRKTGLRSVTKVAMMDSSGEMWSVAKTKNKMQLLRAEIIDIYKNYRKPLSVIIVVPYAVSEAYTGAEGSVFDKDRDEFRVSDASLLQTLQTYQKSRLIGVEDKFYFVLTKWDMHTKVIATEEFFNPDEELVSALVAQRFPQAYNFFKGMSQENAARCTPYSAGLIGGNQVLEVPQHLRPLLHEFPYRLWRWIYANATGGADLYGTGKPPRGGKIANFFRELFS